MTNEQALKKCRKMWGPSARAEWSSFRTRFEVSEPYLVGDGRTIFSMGFIWGAGSSWAKAIKAAEKMRQDAISEALR